MLNLKTRSNLGFLAKQALFQIFTHGPYLPDNWRRDLLVWSYLLKWRAGSEQVKDWDIILVLRPADVDVAVASFLLADWQLNGWPLDRSVSVFV